MQARCSLTFLFRINTRPVVSSTALAPFRPALRAGKMFRSIATSNRGAALVRHGKSSKKHNRCESRQHPNRWPEWKSRGRMCAGKHHQLQSIYAVGERIDLHEPLDPSRGPAYGKERAGKQPQGN